MKNSTFLNWMFLGLMICFLFKVACVAKNPGEPDPDPCDECEAKPCEPVPCEPVPCDIVRFKGVWEIFLIQDPSENNYTLFQNDSLIFSKTTKSGIVKELRFEVPGTYKMGDVMELVIPKASKAGFRYAFHANE